MLHMAGNLAKERKERGLKLNYPEALAYISSELLELARDGKTVVELMQLGTKILTKEDVMNGVADMIGGGTGPADGTNATTCTPGPWNLEMMLKAAEEYPMNLGFLGKGNCSDEAPLAEQVKAGAMGLKIHEDWGATPAVINHCLNVADEYDVQVAIHTDTLNEGGCVEDTLAAIGGRTIHTYHTEGAGGGHAPDIIRAAAAPNVLPSSTNPTMPYTVNTLDEHLDMLMVCHHLDKKIPEDVAFADSRIRPETIAAEDVLHDMGVFSMMSSDSQAMGRVGEVITRTWQTASKMKDERGALPEDEGAGNDNYRVKRYISKYTINPAITHGISQYVGSVETGKFADLVLWNPGFFGVKPDIIIKGGMIIASKMGDANASIPTTQPVLYQPMFGAHGKAKYAACLTFVSQAAMEADVKAAYGLEKTVVPVKGCRSISKKDMVYNDRTPEITVDSETYEVTVDGEAVTSKPADKLPLTCECCDFRNHRGIYRKHGIGNSCRYTVGSHLVFMGSALGNCFCRRYYGEKTGKICALSSGL